ncbi:MAG TPA: hypothetical protein VEK84_10825 [Terriglobales bacterium]|nr:hypothetical protein [Terriglobales bacterium]
MDPDSNAGLVLRVDIDMDGDGLKDLLLANGQRMGSSGFAQWFVYRAKGKGVFQCIGSFSSGPKSFRVLANPSRVEVLAFRRDDNDVLQPYLDTYSVSASAIGRLSSTALDTTGVDTARQNISHWQTASGFRLLTAALDARGRFDNPVWTEFGSDQPATGVTSIEGLVVEQ